MITDKIQTENMFLYYDSKMALSDISIKITENKVTALIGPSGCGKSTFLRSLNRMNDLIDKVKIEGKVMIDQIDIYEKNIDVVNLRNF
jgi:phosphate transport system ATP-binding protein